MPRRKSPSKPPAPVTAVVSNPVFDDAERRAWSPPDQVSVPEWAEKNRYLTRRQTSRPGPWRNSAAPHAIGIMLMASRPGVEQLNILKASQASVSEAVRCVLAKFAIDEKDPALLVLPDKEKGKAIIRDRIRPLFEDTEVLRPLLPSRKFDLRTTQLDLANGFTLRLGYSGSISSVASDPARLIICDERSKFQSDGKVSIADSIEARTATYDNSIVINLSSPGPDPDPTDALYEASQIKLQYFVPCPHCGRHQVLTFGQLKWTPNSREEPDPSRRAARILKENTAWIQCENPTCAGQIRDEHKRDIVPRGYWATPDQGWKLFNDGHEEGEYPIGNRVGMHVPAFITLAPKHRFTRIAERFILAGSDLEKLRGFYNEVLGEVFEQQTASSDSNTFALKCRPNAETGFKPAPPMVVPAWASRLLLTVDTQKDHFYFTIRAWGQAFRSRRIHHGRVLTFEELTALADNTFFRYENDEYRPLTCSMTGIDSGGGKMGLPGSRTDEVYRWCLRDPARRKPLKGESEPRDVPIRWRKVIYEPPDRKRSPYTVFLHMLDAGHFNDLLAAAIEAKLPHVDTTTGEVSGEVDQWELNSLDDDEYNRHMSAVHKTLKGNKERWKTKTEGARHDYRDCEKMQFALAQIANFAALPSPEQLAQQRRLEDQAARQRPRGITTPDGRPFLATQR